MRILLVDDVPFILTAYVRQVQDTEFRTAAGVCEAQALLASGFVPDVTISDYSMPDGTGLDVLVAVKQHCPRCRCYIATGTGDLPAAVYELADGVLAKTSPELPALLRLLNSAP